MTCSAPRSVPKAEQKIGSLDPDKAAAPFAAIKQQVAAALGPVPGIEQVEALVNAKLDSEAPLLGEIGSYLFDMGGKRMRPLLTLIIARAFGMQIPTQSLINVAAGIELIHMATLLHDDIIDRSPLRRHRASPLARYGVESTLLCGDFLLVRAFSLCARLDQFVIDQTETACIELTEGEILEIPLYRKGASRDDSVLIAKKKTASLFRLAALTASHLCQAAPPIVQHLGRFAEYLGIGFQILDDVLDVAADEATLGKKNGVDILERKPSMVNVLWLARGSELSKRLLCEPGTPEEEAPFVEAALQEIRTSGVLEEARTHAQGFIELCRSELHSALDLARASGGLPHGASSLDNHSLNQLEMLIGITTSRLG